MIIFSAMFVVIWLHCILNFLLFSNEIFIQIIQYCWPGLDNNNKCWSTWRCWEWWWPLWSMLSDVIFRISSRCLYDPLSGYLYNLSSATRAEGRTRHFRSPISVNSFVLSIKAQRKEKLILENKPIASEWSLVAEQPKALFTKLCAVYE